MNSLSLDALGQDVDSLIDQADTLAGQITADAQASALRVDLAQHVLPLGVKDSPPGLAVDRARRLAALSRQRVRLLREGHVLAQRLAELNHHTDHLSRLREETTHAAAHSRESDALSHLRTAKERREAVLAWADERATHRRQVIDWASRIVQHHQESAPALPSSPRRHLTS